MTTLIALRIIRTIVNSICAADQPPNLKGMRNERRLWKIAAQIRGLLERENINEN